MLELAEYGFETIERPEKDETELILSGAGLKPVGWFSFGLLGLLIGLLTALSAPANFFIVMLATFALATISHYFSLRKQHVIIKKDSIIFNKKEYNKSNIHGVGFDGDDQIYINYGRTKITLFHSVKEGSSTHLIGKLNCLL